MNLEMSKLMSLLVFLQFSTLANLPHSLLQGPVKSTAGHSEVLDGHTSEKVPWEGEWGGRATTVANVIFPCVVLVLFGQ